MFATGVPPNISLRDACSALTVTLAIAIKEAAMVLKIFIELVRVADCKARNQEQYASQSSDGLEKRNFVLRQPTRRPTADQPIGVLHYRKDLCRKAYYSVAIHLQIR